MTDPTTENQKGTLAKNGEVVIGDLEYDGRVILYIIKGFQYLLAGSQSYSNHMQPIKHPTSTILSL